MEKYGVLVNLATTVCPRCRGLLNNQASVPHCPKCGTEEMEKLAWQNQRNPPTNPSLSNSLQSITATSKTN